MGLGQKKCKAKGNKKTKNQHKAINVVGGMENVMLFGFYDVMMQSSNFGNVQDYSNSCIRLLLRLFNICRYGCFSLGFG
jgi:hypothetical protein